MDISERYTTRNGRRYLIKLSYNEQIQTSDPGTAFVRNLDVQDTETKEAISVPSNATKFSTYENFQSFGGYIAVNYLNNREAAIEGLRTKILTRVEDYLERLG